VRPRLDGLECRKERRGARAASPLSYSSSPSACPCASIFHFKLASLPPFFFSFPPPLPRTSQSPVNLPFDFLPPLSFFFPPPILDIAPVKMKCLRRIGQNGSLFPPFSFPSPFLFSLLFSWGREEKLPLPFFPPPPFSL